MTLYQFNTLDEMEQAEAVWSGTQIGERQDTEHNILLYQIDGFYVEVFYHREYNAIVRFRSFSNPDQLQPYLHQVNIDNLFTGISSTTIKHHKSISYFLLNAYRHFFNVRDTTSDKQVWVHFILIIVLVFVAGFFIGRLLGS